MRVELIGVQNLAQCLAHSTFAGSSSNWDLDLRKNIKMGERRECLRTCLKRVDRVEERKNTKERTHGLCNQAF